MGMQGPESCDEGTAFEDCTCYIPDEYFDDYGAYQMLNDTNVFHYLTSSNGIYYSSDDDLYHYTGITGEMYTSAAPWDPSFWPIHPTADRLVMYRRYLHSTGQLYLNSTWGYYHDPDIPS